jgi:hypothetical protein
MAIRKRISNSATGDGIMGLREAYQEMHEARLRELDAEVQQLESRAMQAKASAKILYYQELQAIYKKRDTAESKLDALKQASGEAWQEFKHGLEAAWHEFRDGVKGAATKLQNH